MVSFQAHFTYEGRVYCTMVSMPSEMVTVSPSGLPTSMADLCLIPIARLGSHLRLYRPVLRYQLFLTIRMRHLHSILWTFSFIRISSVTLFDESIKSQLTSETCLFPFHQRSILNIASLSKTKFAISAVAGDQKFCCRVVRSIQKCNRWKYESGPSNGTEQCDRERNGDRERDGEREREENRMQQTWSIN